MKSLCLSLELRKKWPENMIEQIEFTLPAFSRGHHLITQYISEQLKQLPPKGILNIFIKHTSAGLTINENADSSVRDDFNSSMDNLIKENEDFYTHTIEGPDDMPAHIKSSLVGHNLSIPITNHQLNLGTWQGIYLCEYRTNTSPRKLVLTLYF